jgi:hypothetical protein
VTREFGLVNPHGEVVAISRDYKLLAETIKNYPLPQTLSIVWRYVSTNENGEKTTGAWVMGEE